MDLLLYYYNNKFLHSVGFGPTRFDKTRDFKSRSLDHSDRNACWYIIQYIMFFIFIFFFVNIQRKQQQHNKENIQQQHGITIFITILFIT